MSEDLFIRHCSPTLAGLKTGNLFNCESISEQEAVRAADRMNQSLGRKGIRVMILRHSGDRALVYIYRPTLLEKDLQDPLARRLLRSCGYPDGSSELALMHLLMRIADSPCFPHEIGLFLGYPPEDVQGFIENQAANCKCCGCWKVYGDAEKAQRLFAMYRKCTEVYSRRWMEGFTLDRLTVAV